MVMAYVLVCGTLFSALCVISSRCSVARTASARPGYPAAPGVPPVVADRQPRALGERSPTIRG